MAIHSSKHGFSFDTKSTAQFGNMSSYAHNGEDAVAAPIPPLLKWGLPSTIVRGIGTIVVDPAEGLSFGPMAHVSKEVPEIPPSVADINASGTVVIPAIGCFLVAPGEHLFPECVDGGLVLSWAESVLPIALDCSLPDTTSTGYGCTGADGHPDYNGSLTAIAPALIASLAMFAVETWLNFLNYEKSSKFKSNEGYFCRHDDGRFIVVFSVRGPRQRPSDAQSFPA